MGRGPNTSPAFTAAVEALFSLSCTLKFMVKKGELGVDYGVLLLQALWWSDDPAAFRTGNKDVWKWAVMIMQPEFVTSALIDEVLREVQRKKKLMALSLVRYESFKEGNAAQIMHIGPFSGKGPTIEKVHFFIENSGNRCHAEKQQERYFSGFPKIRRVISLLFRFRTARTASQLAGRLPCPRFGNRPIVHEVPR